MSVATPATENSPGAALSWRMEKDEEMQGARAQRLQRSSGVHSRRTANARHPAARWPSLLMHAAIDPAYGQPKLMMHVTNGSMSKLSTRPSRLMSSTH